MSSYKKTIVRNLIKTMNLYSYELSKSLELEDGIEYCVFIKDNSDIVIFTFGYISSSEPKKHELSNHYLNNGFYRKEINGRHGYYGIISESDKEWEKFTYLMLNDKLLMTISRLCGSSIHMNELVQDYLRP